MRSQRVIVIAGLLAALIAAAPAAGATSTLLSGYGGPGQGNQAILGSAVVKGGGGGGSRGGGSNGSSHATGAQGSAVASEESGSEPSLVASESSHPATGASGAATGQARPRRSTGQSPSTAHGRAAGTGAKQAAHPTVAQASFYPTSERLAPGQQDSALGISGGDLLFLLLGVAVLVSLGVLTRRAGEPDGHGAGG